METPIFDKPIDGLVYNGDLVLTAKNYPFETINNLTVNGRLVIQTDTIIKEITGEFKVTGIFVAEKTKLEYLPDGTEVGDCANLKNSKLRKLPKGMKVAGHFFGSGLPLEEIPTEIEVGKFLYLHGCFQENITLPDSVKCSKFYGKGKDEF